LIKIIALHVKNSKSSFHLFYHIGYLLTKIFKVTIHVFSIKAVGSLYLLSHLLLAFLQNSLYILSNTSFFSPILSFLFLKESISWNSCIKMFRIGNYLEVVQVLLCRLILVKMTEEVA